jgi:hypothetical protein
MLEKQGKVQQSQHNHRNMMNKLEKGKTTPKLALQQQMKPTHHKKEEKTNINKKIEYTRSVFLNTRRLHIKNDIDYKSGDKHSSRVNSNDKEFIKFTKRISKGSTTLTMFLMLLMLMVLMFLICLIINLIHPIFL